MCWDFSSVYLTFQLKIWWPNSVCCSFPIFANSCPLHKNIQICENNSSQGLKSDFLPVFSSQISVLFCKCHFSTTRGCLSHFCHFEGLKDHWPSYSKLLLLLLNVHTVLHRRATNVVLFNKWKYFRCVESTEIVSEQIWSHLKGLNGRNMWFSRFRLDFWRVFRLIPLFFGHFHCSWCQIHIFHMCWVDWYGFWGYLIPFDRSEWPLKSGEPDPLNCTIA